MCDISAGASPGAAVFKKLVVLITILLKLDNGFQQTAGIHRCAQKIGCSAS